MNNNSKALILTVLVIFSMLAMIPDAQAGWWDDFVDWVQEFFVIEDRDEAVAKALEIVGENISYTKDYEHIEFLYEDGSKSGGAITLKRNGYAQEENSKWRKRELATNLMKTYGITFQDTDYYHKLNFISYNATEIILETQGLVSATNIPIYFYENYYNDTTEQIEKNYLEFEIEEITNGTDKVKHGKKKEHKINLNTGQKKTFSIKGINLGDPQVNIHTGYASNKATGVPDFADAVLQFKHDPGGGSCTAPNWRDVISGNFSSGSFTLAFASSDSRSDAIKVYCDSGDSVQLYRTYMGWDIPSFVYDQFDGGSLQLTMDTTSGTFVVLNGTHNLTLSNNLATWNAYQGIPLGEGNMTMNGTNNLTFSSTDMDKFIDENGFTGLVYRHKQYDYDGGFADVASDTIGLYFESASAPNTPILTILYSSNAVPTTTNVILNSTSIAQLNKSNENLQANADVQDPEGNLRNCNIDWYKDGVNQTTLHDSFDCTSGTNIEYILDSANTSKDDLWAFAITSVDNLGKNSSTEYSNNVTIQGTLSDPTVILNSTLTAQTNYTNETLGCFFSCSDDTGGNTITFDLEYRNETNGVIHSIVAQSCTNPSSNSIDLTSENTTVHETYSCNVNLTSSATETSLTVFSNNLSIRGLPPVNASIITPGNDTVITSGTVTLNVTADDVENDTLSFEVYRDATPVPTTLIANETTNIISNDTADGSYYYRMRVVDRDGQSEYTTDLFLTVDSSGLKNKTAFFNDNITEGSTETFRLNVSHNPFNINWTNGTLRYDNKLYDTSQTNHTDSLTEFVSTITIPDVESDELKFFNWTIELGYVNASKGTETSLLYNQTVSDIGAFTCDGVTNITQALAYNFTFGDELNDTLLKAESKNGFNFDAVFELWTTDPEINKTLTLQLTNQTEVDICISPSDETFKVSATVNYDSDKYFARQYFLRTSTVNNNTQNVTLYTLLEDSDSFARLIKVQNRFGEGIENVVIYLNKFFIGQNVYKLVAMGLTDENGEYNIPMRSLDTAYRFRLVQANEVKFSDDLDRRLSESTTEITLPIDTELFGDEFQRINGLQYTLTNTSTQIVLNYIDSVSSTNCLSVIRRNSTFDNWVYRNCIENSNNGELKADFNESGNYVWAFYSTSENLQNLTTIKATYILVDSGTLSQSVDNELRQELGLTGVFAAFFVVLTLGLLGAVMGRTSTTIIGTILGLIISVILNLITIEWGTLISLVVLGGLLITLAKN